MGKNCRMLLTVASGETAAHSVRRGMQDNKEISHVMSLN